MKVVPFPGGGSAGPDEAWLAELEAALNGDGEGAIADSWRELRRDVRALAPPIAPEFERKLGERVAERGAPSVSKRPHSRSGWLRPPGRLGAAASIAAIGAVVAAVVIAGPWRAGTGPIEALPHQPATSSNAGRAEASTPGVSASKGALRAAKGATAGGSASASAGAVANAPASAPAAGGAGSAPGRVQQLAASITLAAAPNDVQETADRVSRLAVSDGGFVQSSRVQVQQAGTSEASLALSIPSAKLSTALASLGQIAPVRAENQTLQDITSTYDAATQRLGDATAERSALLHALSKATTEGQIDSLHERISQNHGAIAHARSSLQTVSQHASTAEVEVTVTGDAHTGSEGLTAHRGLHDAGRVLVVTLVVLLIAAAILVPLALLFVALATARRMWRRYQRERVLDTR
ncbi:MAG TPA: DUF4349 domain-containing protein [Solirubrobacteraceae bacterium]|jgi:hypothetical protein